MIRKGGMSKLMRVTVGAVTTIGVHARDVVIGMVKQKVDSPESFAWLCNLRYYWREIGGFVRKTGKPNVKMECQVAIVNSKLEYGSSTWATRRDS